MSGGVSLQVRGLSGPAVEVRVPEGLDAREVHARAWAALVEREGGASNGAAAGTALAFDDGQPVPPGMTVREIAARAKRTGAGGVRVLGQSAHVAAAGPAPAHGRVAWAGGEDDEPTDLGAATPRGLDDGDEPGEVFYRDARAHAAGATAYSARYAASAALQGADTAAGRLWARGAPPRAELAGRAERFAAGDGEDPGVWHPPLPATAGPLVPVRVSSLRGGSVVAMVPAGTTAGALVVAVAGRPDVQCRPRALVLIGDGWPLAVSEVLVSAGGVAAHAEVWVARREADPSRRVPPRLHAPCRFCGAARARMELRPAVVQGSGAEAWLDEGVMLLGGAPEPGVSRWEDLIGVHARGFAPDGSMQPPTDAAWGLLCCNTTDGAPCASRRLPAGQRLQYAWVDGSRAGLQRLQRLVEGVEGVEGAGAGPGAWV